jgi:hypothetical protein
MSKTNALWTDKYEAASALSDFSEFRREMSSLGFSTDEILSHWDAAGKERMEETPCVSTKT